MKSRKYLSNVLTVLLVAGTTAGLIGCVSSAEKQARRDNAYDLSGEYKTQKNSEVDMEFKIINQGSRHDIRISLDRTSPQTKKEQDFLKSHNIDINSVNSHFAHMELGKGSDKNNLDGGKNISDDFGESSKFAVCTDDYNVSSTESLYYCLTGSATKAAKRMNGNLMLGYWKSEKQKDGSVKYTFDHINLAYNVDMNQMFFHQYLGKWTGESFKIASGFNIAQVNSLIIAEDKNAPQGHEVTITPVMAAGARVTFVSEDYYYSALLSAMPIETIRDPQYPSIQMVFTNKANTRRIVWVGEIWSLGNLSGSVVLIDNNSDSQVELASFKLKKD